MNCQKPPIIDRWHAYIMFNIYGGFGHYKIPLIVVVFEHIQIPYNVLAIRKPLMKHKWNFDV